jgi:hypothetical protein
MPSNWGDFVPLTGTVIRGRTIRRRLLEALLAEALAPGEARELEAAE